MTRPLTADDEADRLMQLLDVGLDQLRKGDDRMALLAVQEALKSAERLPRERDVICLPDRSSERP